MYTNTIRLLNEQLARVTYVANVLGSERLEVRVDRALSHDDDVQALSRQVLALHAQTECCIGADAADE